MGTGLWAAWTGGKPNGSWTGLEEPNPKTIKPNQYRSPSISTESKSRAYRVQGLEMKYSRDSNLQTFQKEVMQHLSEYGMDTITYLNDPTDATRVVSVIEHHALFDLKDGETLANETAKNHFDLYDHGNSDDAKKFLLRSISEELKNQLYENCRDDDCFVAYWLNLMYIVRSVSIHRFDKVKDRIRERNIKNYSGENIEEIVTDFLTDWNELHKAGMYDQTLTLTMLNKIMEADNFGDLISIVSYSHNLEQVCFLKNIV